MGLGSCSVCCEFVAVKACRQSSVPVTHVTRLGVVVSSYNTSAGEADRLRSGGHWGQAYPIW